MDVLERVLPCVALLEDLDGLPYNIAVQLKRQLLKRLVKVKERSPELFFAFHSLGRLIYLSNVPQDEFEIPPFPKLPAAHHEWLANSGVDTSFMRVVGFFDGWRRAPSQSDWQQFAGQPSLFCDFSHGCLLGSLSNIVTTLCQKPLVPLLVMCEADPACRALKENRASTVDEMLGSVLHHLETRCRHLLADAGLARGGDTSTFVCCVACKVRSISSQAFLSHGGPTAAAPSHTVPMREELTECLQRRRGYSCGLRRSLNNDSQAFP